MESAHRLPLVGPGFRAFDLDAEGTSAPDSAAAVSRSVDPAAEPDGFLVAMDGGWKSTATGLAGYNSIKFHHNVHTMQHSKSFMDRKASQLHSANWRMGSPGFVAIM